MKRLALFAKRPEQGRVKTRLSPALPAGLAFELYRAMLADALETAAQAADERYLYWSEPEGDSTSRGAAPAPSAIAPPTEDRTGSGRGDLGPAITGFQGRIQRGPDLGARLEHAFAELLAGPSDRAVIIGADCPGLDSAALRSAFEALESRDLIVGPTRDGGYYLIGLRRLAPEIFRDIAWSTDRVLEQTLERARGAKLTIAALDELEDLDTPEDLVRWLGRAASEPTPGRHTAEALRAMGLLPARAAVR